MVISGAKRSAHGVPAADVKALDPGRVYGSPPAGRLLSCLARGRPVVVMPHDPHRVGEVYQRRVMMVSR